MREHTTLLTDNGVMISVRNPSMMTPVQMMKFENLADKPMHQMMHFFECILIYPDDMAELEKMSADEIGRLLEQLMEDFSVRE